MKYWGILGDGHWARYSDLKKPISLDSNYQVFVNYCWLIIYIL